MKKLFRLTENTVFYHLFFRISLLILLTSCSSGFSATAFEKKSIPYGISAKMVIEPSNVYEIAGVDFTFLNKADKGVKAFTLMFFMYDEDGDPPGIGNNGVSLEILVDIEKGAREDDIVSLDQFLYEIPDIPYQLDYVYVSRIVYDDGSEWRDPFGMYAVN